MRFMARNCSSNTLSSSTLAVFPPRASRASSGVRYFQPRLISSCSAGICEISFSRVAGRLLMTSPFCQGARAGCGLCLSIVAEGVLFYAVGEQRALFGKGEFVYPKLKVHQQSAFAQ